MVVQQMTSSKEKAISIWNIINLMRDIVPPYKYQDIILPFTFLRRLDCILEPTKEKVLEVSLSDSHSSTLLCHASGYSFYNIYPYTFPHLLEDRSNIGNSLREYINGFSTNIRQIMDDYNINSYIRQLTESNVLYPVIERFSKVDLHLSSAIDADMKIIFEELIILSALQDSFTRRQHRTRT